MMSGFPIVDVRDTGILSVVVLSTVELDAVAISDRDVAFISDDDADAIPEEDTGVPALLL